MLMLSNITQPPCEFLSDLCLGGLEESNLGFALVLEIILFSYAFVGLAIVCDDYLVMSLEQVRKQKQLFHRCPPHRLTRFFLSHFLGVRTAPRA